MTDDDVPMGLALEHARRALAAGGVPVGACIVGPRGTVAAGNEVVGLLDPTAHAEIQAIRAAARQWRRTGLADCRLYSTVEPCPMCRAACHYAGIGEVIYGLSLAEMHALTGAELVAPADGPGPRLRGGCRTDEARALVARWAQQRPPA